MRATSSENPAPVATSTFRAMVVDEVESKRFERTICDRRIAELPDHDVLIRVAYSSLNYKDALSATGKPGVTRAYPHTPGIDAAGVVAHSRAPELPAGREVLVTGYDLGMNTPGGFGEFIRVPAEWVVPLPDGLSPRESMSYGTAGFTAALSISGLQRHGVRPEDGDVLVTGASGGVGSLTVALLAHLGYRVVAATGKPDASDMLTGIGAAEVVERASILGDTARPLLKSRWAGAVDTVGGDILSAALRATGHGGAVACCGNARSADLALTVYPFILRAIALVGVGSQNCPMPERLATWQRLATTWRIPDLTSIVRECELDALDPEIDNILAGEQTGRVLGSDGGLNLPGVRGILIDSRYD